MTPKLSILRSLVLGVCAVTAATAALLPAHLTAQATPSRVLLAPGNPQALAAAADSGAMPSSQRVSLTLTLTPDPARAAALDQYLSALTTPASPSYHQWLTPAQFAAAYGATPAQLAAASAWASDAGLTVDATSPAATRITVSGSAARVQAAFATSLHLYQVNTAVYYAAASQPSLPAAAAPLFAAVEGLDNLPASAVFTGTDFATLAAQVDANTTAILPLTGTTALSAAQLPEYTQLFRQAAAQGMTTLLPTAAGTFADAATLADASTPAVTTLPRPTWQAAPGLPGDDLRDTPDFAVASSAAFTQALNTLAASGRLGNIAPVVYKLAPTKGLFDQAGNWQQTTGLGTIDPTTFAAAYPRGTGMSYTSFAATNYSPNHGQSTTFSSNVTSGTGGATPTGTVSFVTSSGTNLGTVTLVGGSASLSLNNLSGGNYTVGAVYNGDGSYASSQSPTAQIYVGPEPSMLSAAVTGSPTVGGNFTVVVTDTVTQGVPTGGITLQVSGTSTNLSQTLVPASATSATATFTVPSPAPGGITLSINCTTTANYSCNNPYTTTVQIAKATPVLSISYTPNPPLSGGQIALNAVVSTIGNAPAPTGNVTFYDNGTVLNAGALAGGATSSTGTVPTTATHSITATYSGDPNYNTATTSGSSSTSGTISTTLKLSSSATTVNSGATINFTAVLTPSSTGPATPTGTVQFFDGGASIGTANLSGNSATFSSSTLSATTSHNITAIYSGDGSYTTSTSNPVALTAGASTNNTTVTLTPSSTTPLHGGAFALTATVNPPNGGATPTGIVGFSSQAGALAAVSLVNGVATYYTSTLPGGAYTFTATYNGSGTYNSATSASVSVTVQPEPTNLTTTPVASATFGSPFAILVNAAGGSPVGVPTGIVTGTPSGNNYSAKVSANLKTPAGNTTGASGVNLVFQATGAGSVIVSVTYAGDPSFAASGPVSTTVTVARGTSTVSLGTSPTPLVSGQPTLFTSKVSLIGTVVPTGTVQFLDGTTLIGTGTLDTTGTATYTSTLAVGNHVLSASYSGDANYLPGASPAANTNTGTAASSTALTLAPAILATGSTDTLTAMVTGSATGATPTGMVQFLSQGNVLCSVALSAGQASCYYLPPAPGNYPITASYLGDTNYAASTSAVSTLMVGTAAGGLTASVSPANVSGNTSATVTATVVAPTGVVPTGSITATILDSNNGIASTYNAALPAGGTSNTATVNIPVVSPQPTGNYTIVVSCTNTNFTCTNVNLPFTVGTPANGTATLTASVTPASAQPGASATVTGTLTAATGTTLTGTVTATITGVSGAVYVYTLPGTAVTTTAFSIPITVPAIPGVYSVSVTCNSTAFSCTPVTTSLTSSTSTLISTKTSLTATASTTVAGSTTLTATILAATAGTAGPSGSVTFYDGTTPVGVALVSAGTTNSSSATITITPAKAATHSYTAVYSGDAVYAASTSPAVTGTTVAMPATINLTASTNSAISGTNVILTAQVLGLTSAGVAPTGTVTFYIVGASAGPLGTVALTPNGSGSAVAVLTTTGLPSGTLTIDAVYSGDTNFTTVTSNIITLGTTDFNVTFNPPTLTLIRGNTGTATATVSFLGGLSGVVTLGCTPPASAAISCSFSPAVVNGTGTSTLTVSTTSPRAALNHAPALRTGVLGTVSFAALLCLLLPGRNRRRIPTLLLTLLSLGLMSGLGCSQNNFNSSPLNSGGSPLGTSILTITTAGTDGVSMIRHTYYYQITLQ